MNKFRSAALGFTLVELMVALVIGLLLMAAVSQVYLANKTTFNTQDQTSQVMEAGNLAMGFLSRDLRMAAYAGCKSRHLEPADIEYEGVPKPEDDPDGDLGSPYSVFAGGISGAEADGTGIGSVYSISNTNPGAGGSFTPGITGYTGVNTVPGSDVIKIVNVVDGRLAMFDEATSPAFQIDGIGIVKKDDVFAVADCQQATVFKVTGVTESGGKTMVSGLFDRKGAKNEDYANFSTQVYAVRTTVYSVAKGADGTPTLVRATLGRGYPGGSGVPDELIGGVDSMQVTYGVGEVNDIAGGYISAGDVLDWRQVRSVRVSLLIRTPNEIRSDSDTKTYNLAGTTINPVDDRRQRSVVTATIALRDRLH